MRSVRTRIVVIVFVAGVVSSLAGLGLRPAAAEEPRIGRVGSVSAARIFKFGGQARVRLDAEPGLAPAGLSAAQKVAVIHALGVESQPGDVYFSVNATQPQAGTRGAVVYIRPWFTDPGTGTAIWQNAPVGPPANPANLTNLMGPPPGGIALWVHSEHAGKRYLLDCAVRTGGHPLTGADLQGTFTVTGPGNMAETQVVQGPAHVTWVMEGTDSGWYGFNLGADRPWTLFSCQATSL